MICKKKKEHTANIITTTVSRNLYQLLEPEAVENVFWILLKLSQKWDMEVEINKVLGGRKEFERKSKNSEKEFSCNVHRND